MRLPSWRFIRMWQRNRDVFLRLIHTEAPGFILEPVFVLAAMGLGLGAYVQLGGGERYIEFIVPGIIGSYGMFSASFECTYGSFFRMNEHKTYDSIIATPLSVEDVITGEIFWGATRSCLTGTIILLVSTAFGLIHSLWVLLIPPVAFISGLMFSSIAILYTSLVPSFYSFNYYFTLFMTPMFFFGGVFFPLNSFPEIVQRISVIVPLTHVTRVARALTSGDISIGVLGSLGVIIGITLVFYAIALISMRRRLTV